MHTANGTDIRQSDIRHKYGSALAEYLDTAYCGESDDFATDGMGGGWVALYGRRLLSSDSQGFVNVERYSTRWEAMAEWDRRAQMYDNPEEDPW